MNNNFSSINNFFARSFGIQLMLTYVVLVTIALSVISSWALFSIKSESITDLRNSLEVEAVNLALEIDNDLELDSAKSRNRIKSAVIKHASKLGLSITVVDKDGHVIVDSEESSKMQSDQNLSDQGVISEALAGIISSSTDLKSNWLFIAYPVRAAGHTSGVIRIGVRLTSIEQRLNKDLIVFLEITLITFIVTVLISLLVARRVVRPIVEISNLTKQIAVSGDIQHSIPIKRDDEIGELARSFNQMINRLALQEKIRQEFIANASHELKTPTMAISSVVEALISGAKNDKDLSDEFLNSLDKLVLRQGNLIQDLLDISQLDAETGQNWNQEIVIRELILESIDHFNNQAQKKSIELKCDIDSNVDNYLIHGNYNHLLRAVNNLISNAINYSNDNTTIEIKLALIENNSKLAIMIIDSGCGIDENDLNHIFERFYRADKARSRSRGGTGLGLAITHDIISKHNGTINVESKIGVGSKFTLILPVILKT